LLVGVGDVDVVTVADITDEVAVIAVVIVGVGVDVAVSFLSTNNETSAVNYWTAVTVSNKINYSLHVQYSSRSSRMAKQKYCSSFIYRCTKFDTVTTVA